MLLAARRGRGCAASDRYHAQTVAPRVHGVPLLRLQLQALPGLQAWHEPSSIPAGWGRRFPEYFGDEFVHAVQRGSVRELVAFLFGWPRKPLKPLAASVRALPQLGQGFPGWPQVMSMRRISAFAKAAQAFAHSGELAHLWLWCPILHTIPRGDFGLSEDGKDAGPVLPTTNAHVIPTARLRC